MPMETVLRTWTVVSWLLPHDRDADVAAALTGIDADAFALQSLSRDSTDGLADRLEVNSAWELSFHPRSRLLPGGGIGLAVLTRHSIADSVSVVSNNHSSTWSKHRRIAHFAVVTRRDHSGYTIGHAAGSPDPETLGHPPAPLVWFRPPQIGVDDDRAIALPDGATLVTATSTTPLVGANPMLTATFEMPWVRGDFPTG